MRIQYTLVIGLILLAFMLLGVLISAALFKQSDFDKRYHYHEERLKRTSMCV